VSSVSAHGSAMSRYYAWHSRIYDATRWAFLFDRDAILEDLKLAPGQTVVEIGSGTGRNIEGIVRRVGAEGEVLGVDCAAPMIAQCTRRIQKLGLKNVRLVDAEYGRIPLVPGRADAVLMSYSLSMIPAWEAVLECAHRELKPGGRIGVVDFCMEDRTAATRGFSRWMAANHVMLDRRYRETLSSVFRPLQCITRKTFGGLWYYYRFIGQRG
jgi:S-adenosylmethionine-diacylgycerolhomoserine-N-methlytransferase